MVRNMEIRYQTKLTEKSLDFIDDKALQAVLETRLDEIERVFGVNGNLSTIILSISSVEGIFKHQTEKGILIDFEGEEVWIAKSLVNELDEDSLIKGKSCKLNIPSWLAKKEGLE